MHSEVLSERQLSLLPRLGAFAGANGFYLGGGTAVALYYGHRRSVDFDWFTSQILADPLALAERARRSGLDVSDPQVAPGTLHGLVDSVRVSFLEYAYPLLSDPTDWPEYQMRLASLDDLTCMKLAAVAQRGSRKDFLDLYVLATEHVPIRSALELYQHKYGTQDIAHVLLGLSYFDDADSEPPPVLLTDLSWEEVKRQFQEWTRGLAGR